MKINNISRIVILLALVANVITGCRFEEEDLFDTSANLRQEYANREIKKILCSASENGGYGWVFQYFVAGNDDAKYPGFNLYCNFYESGKVVIGGDHSYILGGSQGKYTESASFYEMKKDEANTLAFTTWNDVLTPFVNPDASGEGMHGDCDLVVMSWDENEITFRGTRHSSRSRLLRLDRPIEQYNEEAKEMKNRMNGSVRNFYVINGADTTYVMGFSTGRPTYCERIVDPLEQKTVSCVFTPTGYRTEYAEEIMGEKIQEFTLNEEKSALIADGCDVMVVPMWDEYLVTRNTTWYFDAETLTAEQKQMLAQLDANGNTFNSKYSLKAVGIGKKNNKPALIATYYSTTARDDKKTVDVSIAIETVRPAYGQCLITALENQKGDNNLQNIEKKAPGTVELMNRFAASIAGNYNVVPNDYFQPTGGVFTAVNGDQTFTMK